VLLLQWLNWSLILCQCGSADLVAVQYVDWLGAHCRVQAWLAVLVLRANLLLHLLGDLHT
jgi:hypothetical protein